MTTTRRAVRNLLALAVLAYLAERPMHPYELGKLLKERNQQESIRYRHSSLYMVISQLERAGLVAPGEVQRRGGRPERTVYSLTDAGRVELQEWMRELVATPAKEYRQFEAALALIVVLPPETVGDLLDQRLRTLTTQAERIRAALARAADVDPLFLVEHEYRLALLEAEQAFVRRLAERMATAGPEFGRFWREFHGRSGRSQEGGVRSPASAAASGPAASPSRS
jgi:DNA-binding PadR family transcriptional regulator